VITFEQSVSVKFSIGIAVFLTSLPNGLKLLTVFFTRLFGFAAILGFIFAAILE
jgi:hypothetical protein